MHPQNQLKKEFLQSSAVKPSGTVSANYNNSNYNTMHLVTEKKLLLEISIQTWKGNENWECYQH